jgi:hypothetical protein
MPSSPSSLAPTTGIRCLGSSMPTRRREREAMKRSTASCDTLAVETIGWLGLSADPRAVERKTYNDQRLSLELYVCGWIEKWHAVSESKVVWLSLGIHAPDLHECLHGLLLQLFDHLWHNCEQVSNDPNIGDLEYWRIRILRKKIKSADCQTETTRRNLVDGNYELRIFHASKVLDSSGYTQRHVQFRSNHFPGLADLQGIVGISGINSCPRGAHCSTQHIGQRIECGFKSLCIFQCSASSHDASSNSQIRTIGFCDDSVDMLGGQVRDLYWVKGFDFYLRVFRRLCWCESSRPNGKEFDGNVGRGPNGRYCISGVYWTCEGCTIRGRIMLQGYYVGYSWYIQLCCNPGKE